MMQIKSIILYSNTGEIRQLNFELGRVNLITGDSDTGKSALIPIIDYCLGNSEFEVPEGMIKENIAWYAVLYQIGNTQVFISKPKPKYGNKEHHVFYVASEKIDIPGFQNLLINSSDYDAQNKLSQLLRQSLNLSVLGYEKAENLRTTIDYTRFYLFQERKIIANNEMLFYKQQSDHKTIKETLPYFLGAINEGELTLQENYAKNSHELQTINSLLKRQKEFRESNQEKIKNFFTQAQSFGLIERNLLTEGVNIDKMVAMLKDACNWQPTENTPVTDDFEPQLREKLNQLVKERDEKNNEVGSMESYITNVNGYAKEVGEHQMRLQSIGLFDSNQSELFSNNCPLCDSPLKQGVPSISSMQTILNHLNNSLKFANRDKVDFDSQTKKLKDEIDSLNKDIKKEQNDLYKIVQEKKSKQDFLRRLEIEQRSISEFIGRIKEFFEITQTVVDVSELGRKAKSLEQERKIFKSQLNELKKVLDHKLDSLNREISLFASEINLGYQGNYLFDLENIDITMTDKNHSHPTPMKLMGGGLNTLGCHIVTLLALHEHFVAQKSPVPNFLVLDQPIQGYLSDDTKSYDTEKINKMIELILKVCQDTGLQVILTEHEQLQQEGLHRVESHWATENALIPKNWIK